MENSVFKAHLIRKLSVAGAFTALTVGAIIGVKLTNDLVITREPTRQLNNRASGLYIGE